MSNIKKRSSCCLQMCKFFESLAHFVNPDQCLRGGNPDDADVSVAPALFRNDDPFCVSVESRTASDRLT